LTERLELNLAASLQGSSRVFLCDIFRSNFAFQRFQEESPVSIVEFRINLIHLQAGHDELRNLRGAVDLVSSEIVNPIDWNRRLDLERYLAVDGKRQFHVQVFEDVGEARILEVEVCVEVIRQTCRFLRFFLSRKDRFARDQGPEKLLNLAVTTSCQHVGWAGTDKLAACRYVRCGTGYRFCRAADRSGILLCIDPC